MRAGRGAGLAALASLTALAALGCGYRPLHADGGAGADEASARDPAAPFLVISALPRAPSSAAAAAVESGARSELARAGVLASSSEESAGCSTIEIELLRIEEEGAGIAVDVDKNSPLARGLRLTVTGRARLWAAGSSQSPPPRPLADGRPTPARAPLRDTGDVRASFVLSRGQGDGTAASASREDAARLAGRRLGERLARRILGIPDPGDE